MSSKIYLHQFLSRTGIFSSKKELLEAIKKGEIKIGEKIIRNPLFQFKPKEKVMWKDKTLTQVSELIYIAINKPEGFLSSKLSNYDRKFKKDSVFDLINMDEKTKSTLFCVGRLDENSSGLLIMTNDGKLGSYLTKPGNVQKTYDVILDNKITDEDIKNIEGGISIELEENGNVSNYNTMPCKAERINEKEIVLVLKEGKKREVRRIMETLGNKVLSLKRIAIGNLSLDSLNLQKGEYKILKKEELVF